MANDACTVRSIFPLSEVRIYRCAARVALRNELARERRAPDSTRATLEMHRGDLQVQFRDNSNSPRDLSGVASLINHRATPGFDAFDPEGRGASAGLNFEHIISDCSHRL